MSEEGQTYFITENLLVELADQIRKILGTKDRLSIEEMIGVLQALNPGGEIQNAHEISFSSIEKQIDSLYKINYNWFAQLVSVVQEMIGTNSSMYPQQIINNLKQVLYIPQSRGSSTFQFKETFLESDKKAYNPVYPEYNNRPEKNNSNLQFQVTYLDSSAAIPAAENIK